MRFWLVGIAALFFLAIGVFLMFRAQNFLTAAVSVFPKIITRAMEVDDLGPPQSDQCIQILSGTLG